MAKKLSFAEASFDFDWKELQRGLDATGRDLFPMAAARFLNNIAIDARNRMRDGLNKDFDKPNNFTRNAFEIGWAMARDRDGMFAEVRVKDEQAKYLAFQVFGGERGAGDAGAGKWDVFAHSDKLTKHGGVDRGYLKRLGQRNRKEKQDRAMVRARRPELRARRMWDMNQYSPGEHRELTWVRHSKNRPGIFFGEVDGLKGYWERPKLTKAAKKRQRGVVTVRPVGNNRPKLLMAMKDTVTYKPLFRYDFYVREAFRVKGTAFHWGKAMQHERIKRAGETDRRQAREAKKAAKLSR